MATKYANQSIPVASAPSTSRNKAKMTQEFVTASDKKQNRCNFDVTIKKKMVNGKETKVGTLHKYGDFTDNQHMDEEFTNSTKFAAMVKDKILLAFDEL